MEAHLWHGQVDEAITAVADWDVPHVKNFLDYLAKQTGIPTLYRFG
ncbi:hypothetical protein QUB29_28280 [Microcoleus sp. B4b_D2]